MRGESRGSGAARRVCPQSENEARLDARSSSGAKGEWGESEVSARARDGETGVCHWSEDCAFDGSRVLGPSSPTAVNGCRALDQ